MSSPPSSSTVCFTARSQNCLSPMSPAMVIALRPSFSTICLGLRRIVMLAQIEDRDVGALAGEQRGDRAADAAVGAGDQRDLALEPARARIARLPIGLGLELAFVPGQLILMDHRFDEVGHQLTPWARPPCLPARIRRLGRLIELVVGRVSGAAAARLLGLAAAIGLVLVIAGRNPPPARAGFPVCPAPCRLLT